MVRLTEEQKKFYNDNGYLVLRGIFTEEEIQEISDEHDWLFDFKSKDDLEGSWQGEDMKKAMPEDYSVNAIRYLQFHSAVFSRLLHNENMLEAIEDIMGTPNIMLHHTKAHFKPPKKGAPYLMHQDGAFIPHKKHSLIAAVLHLDKATPENGCICVYPGSHKLGIIDVQPVVTNRKLYILNQEEYSIEKATPVKAEVGDLLIFSYLTVHGSYPNYSDKTRRMFLMELQAADDEPVNETPLYPGQNWMLRGRNYIKSAHYNDRY